MGMAKNIVAAWPTVLSASYIVIVATVIQLMASLILIFFYLMLFIQITSQIWLSNKDCEQD